MRNEDTRKNEGQGGKESESRGMKQKQEYVRNEGIRIKGMNKAGERKVKEESELITME